MLESDDSAQRLQSLCWGVCVCFGWHRELELGTLRDSARGKVVSWVEREPWTLHRGANMRCSTHCSSIHAWDGPGPLPHPVQTSTQNPFQQSPPAATAKKKKNPSQYSIKPQNCKTWDGCSIRQGHPIEPLGWWTCPVRCVVQHGLTAGPWNAAGVTEDLSFSSVSFQLIKSEIYIATLLFWQMDKKKKKIHMAPRMTQGTYHRCSPPLIIYTTDRPFPSPNHGPPVARPQNIFMMIHKFKVWSPEHERFKTKQNRKCLLKTNGRVIFQGRENTIELLLTEVGL